MKAIEVAFGADAHSVDAVQRAAYRFTDRLSMELTTVDGVHRCQLFFHGDVDDEVVGRFRTEVLDQVLRERIRNQTEPERNLVLALAFANTGLGG